MDENPNSPVKGVFCFFFPLSCWFFKESFLDKREAISPLASIFYCPLLNFSLQTLLVISCQFSLSVFTTLGEPNEVGFSLDRSLSFGQICLARCPAPRPGVFSLPFQLFSSCCIVLCPSFESFPCLFFTPSRRTSPGAQSEHALVLYLPPYLRLSFCLYSTVGFFIPAPPPNNRRVLSTVFFFEER